jgi:sarcosine oxidase delta subunit
MKIYIVTSGEYSDYGIDAVFTDEDMAWRFASTDFDYRIETYDADYYVVEGKPKACLFRVTYNFIKDQIEDIETGYRNNVFVDGLERGFEPGHFVFQMDNTKSMYYEIMNNSTGSKRVLKIARDRFAKFLAEHEFSREEVTKQSIEDSKRYNEEWESRSRNYRVRVTTSGDIPANANTDKALRDLISKGEPLPDTLEPLISLFKE